MIVCKTERACTRFVRFKKHMVEISSDTQGRSRRCSQSMLRSRGSSTERSGRQAVLQITQFTQPPNVSLFWWDSSSRAATLAGKQACLRLSNRQHTHNLKLRINQLPPLPNLTLSQKLNKYKVNATTYTRGNHCLACNISQSGQQWSGICGSLQQSSCQLPSIRYYQRTPKNFTSSYPKKSEETILRQISQSQKLHHTKAQQRNVKLDNTQGTTWKQTKSTTSRSWRISAEVRTPLGDRYCKLSLKHA